MIETERVERGCRRWDRDLGSGSWCIEHDEEFPENGDWLNGDSL